VRADIHPPARFLFIIDNVQRFSLGGATARRGLRGTQVGDRAGERKTGWAGSLPPMLKPISGEMSTLGQGDSDSTNAGMARGLLNWVLFVLKWQVDQRFANNVADAWQPWVEFDPSREEKLPVTSG
jgi:hypothetical protein